MDGIDEADDAGRWFEERAARGKISARHRRASIRSLRQGAARYLWASVAPRDSASVDLRSLPGTKFKVDTRPNPISVFVI